MISVVVVVVAVVVRMVEMNSRRRRKRAASFELLCGANNDDTRSCLPKESTKERTSESDVWKIDGQSLWLLLLLWRRLSFCSFQQSWPLVSLSFPLISSCNLLPSPKKERVRVRVATRREKGKRKKKKCSKDARLNQAATCEVN